MPEAAASPHSDATGDSDNDSQHAGGRTSGKNYSIKDKECQYCHQKFTSSSLGRHLDQYLHKKKPDGIHDVDEIRRLRGTITRRTARNSKKHGSGEHTQDQSVADTSAHPSPVPQHVQRPPPHFIEIPADKLNAVPSSGIHNSINRLTWHTTGVINDPASIEPSPSSLTTPSNILPLPNTSGSSPPRKRNFSTYASDLTGASNSTSPTALADTARALELSLREVLDSLRAATKHIATPPSPFDFDLPSQTYPTLVLKLLPIPPTLAQAAPFSTIQSIPISSPGPDQLTPLRNRLTFNIDRWKWSALRLAQRTTSNIADEASFLSSQADSYTTSALQHLNTCYENWMNSSPEQRDQLWHVELLRALQAAKDKSADADERAEQLEQECSQLKQQVEYLSRCQWPREMALWPPDRPTYGKRMREEIRLINLQRPARNVLKRQNSGRDPSAAAAALPPLSASEPTQTDEADDDDADDYGITATENVNTRGDKWDFDKLVNKWRAHVKEDRSRRAPPPPPAQLQHHGYSSGNNPYGGRTTSPGVVVDANGVSSRTGGGGTGQNNGEASPAAGAAGADGLGMVQQVQGPPAPLRRDKPLFGKGNDVRIVSDW